MSFEREYIPYGGSLLHCLVCGIFFLGGLFFLFIGFEKGLADRRVVKYWTKCPAKIISKEIQTIRVPPGKRSSESYRPSVRFEYLIGGVPHQSDHVHVFRGSGGRHQAEVTLLGYSPGQQVEVHVNPSDPTQAVLDPKAEILWPIVFFGISFGTLGLLVLLHKGRSMGRRVWMKLSLSPAGEILPQFEQSLIPPTLSAVGWILYSTAGFALSLHGGGAGLGVWSFLTAHLLMGLYFWFRLLPDYLARRRCSKYRLKLEKIPLLRGAEQAWFILTSRDCFWPRFQLIFQHASKGCRYPVAIADHNYQMLYIEDEIVRPLSAKPSGEGWEGSFLISLTDPLPTKASREAGQWLLKVTEEPQDQPSTPAFKFITGSHETLFVLPEPPPRESTR